MNLQLKTFPFVHEMVHTTMFGWKFIAWTWFFHFILYFGGVFFLSFLADFYGPIILCVGISPAIRSLLWRTKHGNAAKPFWNTVFSKYNVYTTIALILALALHIASILIVGAITYNRIATVSIASICNALFLVYASSLILFPEKKLHHDGLFFQKSLILTIAFIVIFLCRYLFTFFFEDNGTLEQILQPTLSPFYALAWVKFMAFILFEKNPPLVQREQQRPSSMRT